MFGMGVVMHENKIRPRRSTGAVNEGRMRPFIHVVPAKGSENAGGCSTDQDGRWLGIQICAVPFTRMHGGLG
jgi:hypothetical protein